MRNDLTGDFDRDFIQNLWDKAKEREREMREDAMDCFDTGADDGDDDE